MNTKFYNFILLLTVSIFIIACNNDDDNDTTTEVVPIAPSELSGELTEDNQVSLSWTDNSTNENGFKIERKEENDNYTQIASVNANVTNFIDTGLSLNTTYSFRVYSFNEIGNSLTYSNQVTITTSEPITLPNISTSEVTEISYTSAISGGDIISNGGAEVTQSGVVWSTAPNPTIDLDTKTIDGSGEGQFTSNITDLIDGTNYYIRAYGTNSAGTAYGNEVEFSTFEIILLAYYPFNGNANDESGNNRNGTVNGASLTCDRFGNNNQAYSFDGFDDYIEVSPGIDLNEFTISLWVKTTDTHGGLFSKHRQSSLESSYEMSIFESKASVYFTATDDSVYEITESNVSDNTWHHIVGVYDENFLKLFVDNTLVQSIPSTSTIKQTPLSSIIGAWRNNNDTDYSYFLEGSIDDIKIYSRALTELEIDFLHNTCP